jgi:hypothetical protein
MNKKQYYEQHLILFTRSSFCLARRISPITSSTSKKLKLNLVSGWSQLCSLSPLEGHPQCNMIGIAPCHVSRRKGQSHTEQDPGNMAGVQVCETSTHQVLLNFFCLMDGRIGEIGSCAKNSPVRIADVFWQSPRQYYHRSTRL